MGHLRLAKFWHKWACALASFRLTFFESKDFARIQNMQRQAKQATHKERRARRRKRLQQDEEQRRKQKAEDTEDDHPILRREEEAAVQLPKKGKSAGADNIPAELVQAGGENVITVLTTICNNRGPSP